MSIAVKWRSTNRSIACIGYQATPMSATRKQARGGLVENPGDFAVVRIDDLGGNLVGIARRLEDVLHRGRFALPCDQEHYALSVVDHRRRNSKTISRLGIDLNGNHHALRLVQGRIAGKQRRSMAIVAEAEQDQIEARKFAVT